jgi:hypothetical protein
LFFASAIGFISVFVQLGFLPLLHRLVEERAGERRLIRR